jgi:hypothetical protein
MYAIHVQSTQPDGDLKVDLNFIKGVIIGENEGHHGTDSNSNTKETNVVDFNIGNTKLMMDAVHSASINR